MADTSTKSSNMNADTDLSDKSDQKDSIIVDKRTFWLMVAVVFACMSILGICVALVLWKKVCYGSNVFLVSFYLRFIKFR